MAKVRANMAAVRQIAASLISTCHKAYRKVIIGSLGKSGTMYACLTFAICLFPAPVKSLRASLPGELRLALHAPSPAWHAICLLLLLSHLKLHVLLTP